jgi:hypothetical protein
MEEASQIRSELTAHFQAMEAANPGAGANALAALTLAIEAGARSGKEPEELQEIIQAALGIKPAESEAGIWLKWAAEIIKEPGLAEGVWRDALSILQPLGMDLS